MRTMERAAAALLLLGAAGCTLADVVVPESEDVLVVEAVLRTDAERQTIVLHRSVRGRASAAEPGARVVVRGPGGRAVAFAETGSCIPDLDEYAADSLEVRVSCYYSPAGEGRWVRPGERYELEVTTLRGERARGTTTVPGAFALRALPFTDDGSAPVPCALPAGTLLPVRWSRSAGAWGYAAPLRIFDLAPALPPGVVAPEPLELLGVAVSAADTAIVLPSEFGVFDRFSLDQALLRLLQGGLPAGTTARLTVAAADRNYINGVRGGTFNPSGQVRISSVTGDGVGVFGSLVPLQAVVEAGPARAGRPPCLED